MAPTGIRSDGDADSAAEPAPAWVRPDGSGTAEPAPATLVDRDGRRKAYRPLPLDRRLAALEDGLSHYRAGDFFEAHEVLEPA